MATRQYYWIVAHDAQTGEDTLIFGSDRGESEARNRGLMMLSGIDFEIKKYPTKDLSTASALYKGKKLETTRSLHEAKRRLTHEGGLLLKKRRAEKKAQRRNLSDIIV